jgi:hypothetical protein
LILDFVFNAEVASAVLVVNSVATFALSNVRGKLEHGIKSTLGITNGLQLFKLVFERQLGLGSQFELSLPIASFVLHLLCQDLVADHLIRKEVGTLAADTP